VPGADARRAAATDVAALGSAFEEHYEDAVRYAANLLGSRDHLAEDVVQTTFLELLKRVRAGRADFLDDAWKAAIKRNCWWAAHKVHRRERHDVALPDHAALLGGEAASAPDPWTRSELRLEMERLLEELPASMREVLFHRYVVDQSDAASARRLGITVKAFRCRCARALPAAARLLEEVAAGTAGCVLGALLAVRGWLGRRNPAGLGVQATVLAPAVACALVAAAPAGQGVAQPRSDAAGAVSTGAASRTPAGGPAAAGRTLDTGARLSTIAAAGEPEIPHPSGGSVAAPLLPVTNARGETIDDTSVASAASPSAPPGYSGAADRSPIVAFGYGRSCGCSVVLQSTDGGRTWAATPGPLDPTGLVEKVELPATYPADPHIFLTAMWGEVATVYVADGFGAPFQPMRAPSGSMVLAAGFGSSNATLFVGNTQQLLSVDRRSDMVAPVTLSPPSVSILSMATAGPGSDALVEVVATHPGTAPGGQVAALYRCTSPTLCTATATIGADHSGVATMATPRDAALASGNPLPPDETAVNTSCATLLSRDGGRTYSDLGRPIPGGCNLPASAGPVAGGRQGLWVTSFTDSTHAVVAAYDLDTGRWRTVLAYSPTGANPPAGVIPVGGRLLLVYTLGGVACSDDGGAHWARACSG